MIWLNSVSAELDRVANGAHFIVMTMGVAIALAAGVGATMGVALDNIAVGIGASVGLALRGD